MDNENYQNPQQTEQQKPLRSAYTAALLHIFFPFLGFGFFYRAENNKGHHCFRLGVIGLIAVALGSCLSGIRGADIFIIFIIIGAFLVFAVWIWNALEALQLFSGEITEDKKGRTLYQEFFPKSHDYK